MLTSEKLEENKPQRWRIEEPNGPVSSGFCTHCGAEKEFKNWIEDLDILSASENRVGA